MKRKQREAIRERADARKHSASERVREARERKAELEEAARNVLQTRDVTREDRALANLSPGGRALIKALMNGPSAGRRLVADSTRLVLSRLGDVQPVRPFGTWEPRGKGRNSVFRSLCEHLIAKYPTPPFLWSVFDDFDTVELVPLVVHVAQGGSLFQYCKEGKLPFPMTRAQCAEFMQSDTSLNVISALRRVQVKAEGGDRRLFEVWRRLPLMRSLQTPEWEAFSITVLRFFARNPLLDPAQISPLCDYVHGRYRDSTQFSMQGRTANALLRDMNQWHRDLNAARQEASYAPVAFERSGFKGYRVERTDNRAAPGKKGYTEQPQTWTVTEILSSIDLQAEGKALHHCVSSYRAQVEARHVSIWSLALEDVALNSEKVITLEVNNSMKSVVQARGKHNRLTTPQEDKVIMSWAARNGLAIQYGRRW